MTEINCNLLSKPSPRSCKSSAASRVPKKLHQTDSASAVAVQLGRQISCASHSAVFPESSIPSPYLEFEERGCDGTTHQCHMYSSNLGYKFRLLLGKRQDLI